MRLAPVLFACLLSGCATTRITSEDPHAEIYLNDDFIGVGESEVERVGPYRVVHLEARKGGKVVGSETMKRSFTFKTLLWGICSYYTGLYWGWYFPESVRISTSTSGEAMGESARRSQSLWSDPRQSVWMQPLK